MKISERYILNKTQYELDFVDIDTDRDIPLFLDPYFIARCDFTFAQNAHQTIRSYFEFLLALLRGNHIEDARRIFSNLGETNEICMGMSKDKPDGNGMGPKDTEKIFEKLIESHAIETGIMEDIEDFRIFVPNVDKDKVSDMTANIIRKHLIEYTIEQCDLLEIPLSNNVPSGMYWDSTDLQWQNEYTRRLIVDGKPILLVPKRIVSYSVKYTSSVYRQHFLINFLQNEQLRINGPLVRRRVKSREYYVTKKSIKESEPRMTKEYLSRFTLQYPEVFRDFKNLRGEHVNPVHGNVVEEISIEDVSSILSEKLRSTPSGRDHASAYHQLMIGILELLFYPNLSSPKKEQEIHEGRKRIDIAYNNSAETGFFYTMPTHTHITCPTVFVECKNYSREIANPELDQMAGRFSYPRGRFGIVICRTIDNIDLFIKRCADTYRDDRGLIIPIVDDDIFEALSLIDAMGYKSLDNILERRYRQILAEV